MVSARKLAEFCDVFCEKNVFSGGTITSVALQSAGIGIGCEIADEIVQLGGAELAAELGAVSADHLLVASDEGITALLAQAGVVATLLPGTAFSLKESYARGRFMIDQGCAVALATDMNPGSCFTESIPLIFALAVLYMNLSIEEALTAYTINGAAAVGRADKIGSLDVGKQGDLVILEFPSYQYIPYHIGVSTIEKVVKRGLLAYDKIGMP